MKINIMLDFDITDEGLEDNQAHVIVKILDDNDEHLRGGDWFQGIDVDHETPLSKLIGELYGGSWELKAADSDIKEAIRKFCTPHPMVAKRLPDSPLNDWPAGIPF